MEHLRGLNEAQRKAASHREGPLLIVAGAGAGKTKVIVHRILNLIREGVAPEKILAVTFTNKAAKEMRERVRQILLPDESLGRSGDDGQRKFSAENFRAFSGQEDLPFISTFHSLGVHIIRENARLLGLTRHFTILDEEDSRSLVKEIMKELGFDPKQYSPGKIQTIISRERGNFVNFSEYQEKEKGTLAKIISQIWPIYETRKKKENSLDFDDLLIKTVKLLRENEKIRKIYQEKWSHIHIDEYQDTNEAQYLICQLLSAGHKNICAVGDADQNIYSWRGAKLKNILNFEKDFPGTKVVYLEENYRSTKNILEAANGIIKKNIYRPEKNLFTKNETGEKISFYEAIDENDEAEFVATKILEILDSAGESVLERTLGRSGNDGQRKFSAENFRGESENTFSEAKKVKDSFLSGSLSPRARGALPLGPSACETPREEKSFTLPEVAVLYRANFQSRVLEEAMLRYNIPYQVLGVKFFERKEIKDTLAYLRAALNPKSLSDVKRIINFPQRGVGKATIVKIFAAAGAGQAGKQNNLPEKMKIKVNNFYKILEEIKEKIKTEKASETIRFAVKRSGLETELQSGTEEDLERLENIKELATLALKYDHLSNGEGIEKLLEDAALMSEQDSIMHEQEREPACADKKGNKNKVKLMTVHAAKGLEFDYVFVAGLEDGLFPHQRQNEAETVEDKEEERRLFYVALTRARKKVFLSFADFRTIFGSHQINSPSEFIGDIPSNLLERENENKIKTIYLE